jgi:hypothetical protein
VFPDIYIGTRDAVLGRPRSHNVRSLDGAALGVIHHQTYPPDRHLITRPGRLR